MNDGSFIDAASQCCRRHAGQVMRLAELRGERVPVRAGRSALDAPGVLAPGAADGDVAAPVVGPAAAGAMSCRGHRGRRHTAIMTDATQVAAGRFGSMGHYRIYQLDPSDHITAGFSVECGSDAAAMRAARTLLERSAGVEIWKSANRLAHLSPEARLLWDQGREEWMASV